MSHFYFFVNQYHNTFVLTPFIRNVWSWFLDPDYYDVYNPPYGQPGYADYDYGDYNEGVGLYPSKKLTVAQRVSKWFSGFKIPSSKVFSKRWKYDLQI